MITKLVSPLLLSSCSRSYPGRCGRRTSRRRLAKGEGRDITLHHAWRRERRHGPPALISPLYLPLHRALPGGDHLGTHPEGEPSPRGSRSMLRPRLCAREPVCAAQYRGCHRQEKVGARSADSITSVQPWIYFFTWYGG
jgi:hypothetical protein